MAGIGVRLRHFIVMFVLCRKRRIRTDRDKVTDCAASRSSSQTYVWNWECVRTKVCLINADIAEKVSEPIRLDQTSLYSVAADPRQTAVHRL